MLRIMFWEVFIFDLCGSLICILWTWVMLWPVTPGLIALTKVRFAQQVPLLSVIAF